ncbi:MAG: hypothetical protein WBA89_16930 [Microcoleus sp.]|uniref:hypothetical protein n=1 Tax=Microcoleus sp. TaxID=44472 RepID=UPI003C77EBC9
MRHRVKLLWLGCQNNFEAGVLLKIMPRYQTTDNILTLQQALEGIIVKNLKKLNALLPETRRLIRKADLVAAIKEQM